MIELSFNEDKLQGKVQLDGSKSISNRALIIQALCEEPFQLENLSTSDDTKLMQSFFAQYPNTKSFNVHNAGTVARFLTAFLSFKEGDAVLDCALPMKKRPIGILVDALTELGGEFIYLEAKGFLPIKIEGGRIKGNKTTLPAYVSSQYISALMMIGPVLPEGLRIELIGNLASRPYLELTASVMRQFGASVDFVGHTIRVAAKPYVANHLKIESDWSAATFYYTMASLSENAQLQLSYLQPFDKSEQGDAAIIEMYKTLGVNSDVEDGFVTITSSAQKEKTISVDFFNAPDMLPALAVTCAGNGITAEFTGVQNLVIKESNRLTAMHNELAKVGVNFYGKTANLWCLEGKIDASKVQSVVFETYEDHRIAMALACLAVKFGSIKIADPEVVTKSYPAFWEDLKRLGFTVAKPMPKP